MPSLKKTQEKFYEALSQEGEPDSGELESLLQSPNRISAYRDGYISRIYEALEEVFEALFRVLGPAESYRMVCEYVRKHPPDSFNLLDAGKNLSVFLKEYSKSEELPFLSELAEWEWNITDSFHAVISKPLGPSDLEGIDLERIGSCFFRFQESMVLQESRWNLFEIWNQRERDDESFRVDEIEKDSFLLIYRSGYQVRAQTLNENAFRILQNLVSGRTLEESFSDLPGLEEDDISKNFALWMQLGLIIEIVQA